MKCLNLGSGNAPIQRFSTWDNLDIRAGKNVITTDLSKPLKYGDETVDYIYTCHFIEHLSEKEGYNLLKECFRVLKPGGVIRLLTPDLLGYVSIYNNWDSTDPTSDYYDLIQAKKKIFDTKQQWINFAMLGETAYRHVELLNGLSYTNNHHKFIYDYENLQAKVLGLGFSSIQPQEARNSSHEIFNNLDKTSETVVQLVVEITK